MTSNILDLLTTALQKGFPILLSFLDDALLLGLTQIGINLPWLQWLSLVLMSATLIYWSFRLVRFLYWRHSVD